MTLNEILSSGGISLVVLLTLIQIAPIKVNPWSVIMRAIGKGLTADVMDELKEAKATSARYRILRFDDEIRHKTRHTQEHFDQIIEDIDTYEKYCKEHPDFPNGKAVAAIENVRKIYKKCRDENSFLV